MEPWIAEHDFEPILGCGILAVNGLELLFDGAKHFGQ